jgi:hypothetical protein
MFLRMKNTFIGIRRIYPCTQNGTVILRLYFEEEANVE